MMAAGEGIDSLPVSTLAGLLPQPQVTQDTVLRDEPEFSAFEMDLNESSRSFVHTGLLESQLKEGGVCGSAFHYCNKLHETINLKEETIILAPICGGFSPGTGGSTAFGPMHSEKKLLTIWWEDKEREEETRVLTFPTKACL
jgi:hypothetical protein